MRFEDTYVGQLVIGNEAANYEYATTVRGVVGRITARHLPEKYITIQGIQSFEEIRDIKIKEQPNCPNYDANPNKDISYFLLMGLDVKPECFDEYYGDDPVFLWDYLGGTNDEAN